MRKIILRILFMAVIIVQTGCFNQAPEETTTSSKNDVSSNTKAKTYLTYLSSTEDRLRYCDGDKMDSDGYKKTLTRVITTDIAINEMTQTELAKTTIVAATSGMCQTVLKETDIRVENHTVYIGSIERWAGISIAGAAADRKSRSIYCSYLA